MQDFSVFSCRLSGLNLQNADKPAQAANPGAVNIRGRLRVFPYWQVSHPDRREVKMLTKVKILKLGEFFVKIVFEMLIIVVILNSVLRRICINLLKADALSVHDFGPEHETIALTI